MYALSAAELVGSTDDFAARWRNRASFLRRSALAGEPRQLLSIAELDRILHLELVPPQCLRIVVDGGEVSRAEYTRPSALPGTEVAGTVVPEKVYDYFRAGATILWTSLNQVSPVLRAITRMLATELAVEGGVAAFLTPAGRRGFTPHEDIGDVFVIQLEGTK